MLTNYRWLFLLLSLLITSCYAQTDVKEGDLIFQVSHSSQSQAIQLATHSRYSHMGIIFYQNGQPYVYEAAAKVQFTPLKKWIARGEKQHYVVKRLRNADQQLTLEAISKMHRVALDFQGRPYDLTFDWSDTRIYCSELVWKIYQRALGIEIGTLQKMADFDLSSPIVKQKLKERYGKQLPLDETVIAPVSMFDSPLLMTVDSR